MAPIVSCGLQPEFASVHMVTFEGTQWSRLTLGQPSIGCHAWRESSQSVRGGSGASGEKTIGRSRASPMTRAPVGELRWRPPEAPEDWSEVRDTSTFRPIAPQSASAPGITSPSDPEASEPHSEDCLSLNVWTPELPVTQAHAPGSIRPVLFFIHGGGFTSGSGSVFLYRGGNLVRNGNAVVVTIDHRLRALGFLGHRDLAEPEASSATGASTTNSPRWPGCATTSPPSVATPATSRSSVSPPGPSASPCCSGRPHHVGALPSCRGAERRGARADRGGGGALGKRCVAVLGLASCTRDSLQGVPATELVAATEGSPNVDRTRG